MYQKFVTAGQKVDFKNVQRRVYDALNVLSSMDIIAKDKYNIMYNHFNEFIMDDMGDESSEEESTRNFESSQIGGQSVSDAAKGDISGKSCAIHNQ